MTIWTLKTQVMAKRRAMNQIGNLTPNIKLPRFSSMQVVCDITLESSWQGLISIGGVHIKLWAPKVARVPTLEISRLPLGSPETKWHLGASPMARHIVYYKGEGGGFPQVRPVVSLVSPCFSWFVHAPKFPNYALTNLLFSLCKFVWVIELLVNLPSPHPGALAHPSTFEVM